ncbi:MAG: hypothetical protein C9356_12460 [Oleiphilus sp.]|nr:MAG: hypothetical protein C9356_12460 [Oleiphilus sp.]
MTLSRAQARVVDPVLSRTAQGYKSQEFVGHHLMPFVNISRSGVMLMKFGKEAFVRYLTRRAPGSKVSRVQYGFASEPVALFQDSLEGVVPREWIRDSESLPGVNHQITAVNNVMRSIMLGHEVDVAALALDANNYGINNKIALTSGVDSWEVGTVNVAKQFRAYREAIRAQIGVYPNTVVFSPDDWNALAENADVRDRFKYTSSDSLTTAMAAKYLEVDNVYIGKSVSTVEADAAFDDIWTHTVLAYVPPESERNIAVPSYGYSYRLDGHPMVEEGYYEKDIKSWVYPVEYERRPYLVGMNAGFLIQGAAG